MTATVLACFWLAAAVPFAVVVGRGMRMADEHELSAPELVEARTEWAA